MDTISGKKVAAVRLEGTITTKRDLPFDLGDVKPEAVAVLKKLQAEGYYILIMTGLTKTTHGTRMALDYVASHGVPYDEVYASYGLPAAEKWIDNDAEKL